MSEISFVSTDGDRETIRRSGERAGAAGQPAADLSPRCAKPAATLPGA
ncbi:hypothetical protein AB4Z40_03605 [Bosea sp. 2YAB26]